MGKSPYDLVNGSERLLSAPLVYAELNKAISSARTSVGYISTIISQDAGLSARLLRVVNSAFFGFPRKIDTISRAVLIVGTEQLRDLALATQVMAYFKRIPEKYITMESFWRHSVACGIAARMIASLCRESNLERFFVAGILHDIGRLVIYDRIPKQAEEILVEARQSSRSMYDIESNTLGYDHAAVGGALLKAWRLPLNLEEIISCHHSPLLANRYKHDTSIIHIADAIVHALQLGNSGEKFVPVIREEAWKMLELSEDVVPQIFDFVERQANEVYERFISE